MVGDTMVLGVKMSSVLVLLSLSVALSVGPKETLWEI
jgi:hypothetical protein